MMRYKYILYSLSTLFIVSCSSYKQVERQKQEYAIVSMSGHIVEMNQEQGTNDEMQTLVDKYKVTLDNEMKEVLGTSNEFMTYTRPESLLTNLTSDVMLQYGNKRLPNGADIAIMNVNGHRGFLSKGTITVGNLYEVYSFDNTITFLELKGEDLSKIFDAYARLGGAGISSNAHLIIRDRKIKSGTLNGEPLDNDKIYNVVTLDYLADGNDSMDAFKDAIKKTNTGVVLRDIMIDYVRNQTELGKDITSELDGRITIEQ